MYESDKLKTTWKREKEGESGMATLKSLLSHFLCQWEIETFWDFLEYLNAPLNWVKVQKSESGDKTRERM